MDHLGALIDQLRAGSSLEFLFFWGHTPKIQGQVDKACLSQWFPSPFSWEGHLFPTAEHWMMYQKARLFQDEGAARRILEARTPAEAKSIGRGVEGFEAEVWENRGYGIVLEGNFQKFRQNEALAAFLLGTQGRVLVEASPVDPVWGIGLSQDAPEARRPDLWPGRNLLGFSLMEVREKLSRA